MKKIRSILFLVIPLFLLTSCGSIFNNSIYENEITSMSFEESEIWVKKGNYFSNRLNFLPNKDFNTREFEWSVSNLSVVKLKDVNKYPATGINGNPQFYAVNSGITTVKVKSRKNSIIVAEFTVNVTIDDPDVTYTYKNGTSTENITFNHNGTYEHHETDTDSTRKYCCLMRKGKYEHTEYGYKLVSLTNVKNDYSTVEWTGDMAINQPVYVNGDYIYLDGYEVIKPFDNSSSCEGKYRKSFSYVVSDSSDNDIIGVGVKQYDLTFSNNGAKTGQETNYFWKEDYSLVFTLNNTVSMKNETDSYGGSAAFDFFFYLMNSQGDLEDSYYVNKGILQLTNSPKYFVNTSKTKPVIHGEFLVIDNSPFWSGSTYNPQLSVGAKETITAYLFPAFASSTLNPQIRFSSSNSSIATVSSSGEIEGKLPGTVTITASYGELSDKITITIVSK